MNVISEKLAGSADIPGSAAGFAVAGVFRRGAFLHPRRKPSPLKRQATTPAPRCAWKLLNHRGCQQSQIGPKDFLEELRFEGGRPRVRQGAANPGPGDCKRGGACVNSIFCSAKQQGVLPYGKANIILRMCRISGSSFRRPFHDPGRTVRTTGATEPGSTRAEPLLVLRQSLFEPVQLSTKSCLIHQRAGPSVLLNGEDHRFENINVPTFSNSEPYRSVRLPDNHSAQRDAQIIGRYLQNYRLP
jgi:hypothetical protein